MEAHPPRAPPLMLGAQLTETDKHTTDTDRHTTN